MGATFSRIKTWVAEVLTFADLNAEFNNILTNLTPAGVDDASTNAAAMQTTADPYPGGVASLPTSLEGELQRIRYLLAQITGEANWYVDPDITLAAIAVVFAAGYLTPTTGIEKAQFDANTILAANADDTPAAVTVAEQRIVGRITGGDIAALTAAEVRTLLGTTPFVLGSDDADGDMFYRASGLLARLAKGAANTSMFMDAAGGIPEWAVGLKIGSFTRDTAAASGDVAYTGVGFKPSVVIFIAGHSTTSASIGISDGTTHGSIYARTANGMETYAFSLSDAAGSNWQLAIIKSMDADGFTLTWTKGGSPSGTDTINYLAIR